MNPKADKPFQFCTRINLSESTGLRAANLEQLLNLIKDVPGSCIYHHTHRFLQQHEYLSPEPPNDFAYWVADTLGEETLGEKLASIDIIRHDSIRALRESIVSALESHILADPSVKLRFARPGKEFYFLKSVSLIIPTSFIANDLKEFVDIVGRITLSSIYFHIFEARLRLENSSNDFSNWIETSLGDKELACEIARLDPYTYALEDLRKTVMRIAGKRIPGQ